LLCFDGSLFVLDIVDHFVQWSVV